MKLISFAKKDKIRLGAVRGPNVFDIHGALDDLLLQQSILAKASRELEELVRKLLEGGPPADMVGLLARGEPWRALIDDLMDRLTDGFSWFTQPHKFLRALDQTRLVAPILRPGKIVCVGRNYAEHARERGAELPAQPIYFLKSNNTICGPGDAIVLPPASTQVDYEAEFAVVIGKGGKNIPEEEAYEHVGGYMCLNDVSARDLQSADKQWFRGKSCDTFAPIGPWIVTPDEIPDPHNLRISLTLNGRTMQDANTRDMIFKVPFLVSYLSQTLTWEAGDILSTGTPEGVGAHQTPPVFLKPGDTVSITVEKVGTLTNPVAAPQ